MRIKRGILLSLSALLLFSCSKSYIRYGIKEPYIALETANKGELKSITPTDILKKIDNEDTFMLYLNSIHCSYCTESKKNFLNPMLEKNNFIIYGIDTIEIVLNKEENKEEYDVFFERIKPTLENHGYSGIPYYALYQKGVLISGEQESKYFELFFKTYIIDYKPI